MSEPDLRQPRRTPAHLLLVLSVVALCAVGYEADAISRSTRIAAGLAIAVAVGGTYLLLRTVPARGLSLGTVYFLIFVLFHAGLTPYLLLGSAPAKIAAELDGAALWYRSPFIAPSLTAVVIGMLAFLAGYAGLYTVIGGAPTPAVVVRAGRRYVGSRLANPGVGIMALTLVVGGVVLWFAISWLAGGLAFVTQSYLEYRARTVDAPLPYAYTLIGIGMGLLGASRERWIRQWGLAVFASYAVPAFILGNRGVVILPLAAWLVTTARQREIKLRRWHLVVPLAALAIGSVVRQVRLTGLGSRQAGVNANPMDGLAELGETLRTVVVVHHWHSLGEPFLGWGTYWAPIERLVAGRLLGQVLIATGADMRVFTSAIVSRVGPIGGSPVAESYRCAGLLGVAVVLAAIGLAVAWLDARSPDSATAYLVGPIGYVLVLWIRNDFTPVVVQLAFGCVVVAIALKVNQLMVRSEGIRPPQPGRTVGRRQEEDDLGESAQVRVLRGA